MWCRTARQVERTIRRLSADTDVVSFDVFDTLIWRGPMPAEWTKIPAGKRFQIILAEKGIDASVPELMAARLEVEGDLGRIACQYGNDAEYCIEDVLARWAERFVSREEAARHWPDLLQVEIDTQTAACSMCTGMVEAVGYARSLGKRVFAVSDMYLGQEHLRCLLDNCGYGGLFDGYYVSCDHGAEKAGARLYKLMIEREKMDSRRWIHFGDKFRADFVPPRRLGGKSFLYLPVEYLRHRSRCDWLAGLEAKRSEWIGVGLMELVAGRRKQAELEDLSHQIGFWILGPLMCLYVHWVSEEIVRKKNSACPVSRSRRIRLSRNLQPLEAMRCRCGTYPHTVLFSQPENRISCFPETDRPSRNLGRIAALETADLEDDAYPFRLRSGRV